MGAITLGAHRHEVMQKSVAFEVLFTGTPDSNCRMAVEFSLDNWVTSKTWRDAISIAADGSGNRRFRGQIFDLDPNTPHQYRLTVSQTSAITGTNPRTQSFTTYAEPVTWEALIAAGVWDRYVNVDTGNDSNNGLTAGTPWRTLRKATDAAPSGSKVLVEPSATRSYQVNEVWAQQSNVSFVANTNPGTDADGHANTGTRVQVEYGPSTSYNGTTVNVTGPAGSQATYPNIAAEAPWVADGTFVDNLGITRTVYYWALGAAPGNIFYSTTRFGDLQAIAYIKGTTYTDAEWRLFMAQNTDYHSGWHYVPGTGRIYLVMPDPSLDPNALYMTCGASRGIAIHNTGIRVSGFVFRGFNYGIVPEVIADDFVMDRNDVQGCFSGVQVFGNGSNDYAHHQVYRSNRFYWGNVYGATQEATGTKDNNIISWNFIKGAPSGGGLTIGTAAEAAQCQAMYLRGGSQGMTFERNLVDGPFNGLTGDPGGYDSWAMFGAEIYDNEFCHISDDALEPESTGGPWACWDNYFHHIAVVLSTGPVHYGPIYVVRNRIWRWSAEGVGRSDNGNAGVASTIWKLGGGSNPTATVEWLNNTCWTDRGVNYFNGSLVWTHTTNASGYDHNSGGADENLVSYNNIIRATRYASRIPNAPASISTGNHYVSAEPTYTPNPAAPGFTISHGFEYPQNGTNYTTDRAAYLAAYTTQTGGLTTTDNAAGHFRDYAVVDNALSSPTGGNLALAVSSPFRGTGVLVPGWSEAYPGSGPVRVWHYKTANGGPNIGYDEGLVAASDTTPPVFSSASLAADGITLSVVLAETGSSPVLPATGVTGFAVTVGGSPRSILSATASINTVTLTLTSAATSPEAVTVAYTPGNVTDSSANAMTSFGAQSVTNNSLIGSARASATGRVAAGSAGTGRESATGRSSAT